MLVCLMPVAMARAALVSVGEISVNDVDGSVIGAVTTNRFVEIGSAYATTFAPTIWSSYHFTCWSNSGDPGAPYRDAWGRATNPISFWVTVACANTAHYLPTSHDSDTDGIPDWCEIEFFGDLARGAADDGDGDGITLHAEYTGGTSPLHGNSTVEGGVAWADSGLMTCNLAGYGTYILKSIPAGTVNQSNAVAPGTVVTTPDLAANASFGYWTLDGARQQDAWGRALSKFSFTMASADREGIAYLFTGDGDSDGVPDVFEQRYYGTLSFNGASDTDGDGITLLAECNGGTSPIYGNSIQEGGVAWADSSLVTCDLQAEIVVIRPVDIHIVDGGTNDFGSAPVGSPRNITFIIRNVGGMPLAGLAITKDGGDAAAFNVLSAPVPPVPHNCQTTFTLEFAPGSGGPKTAAIHITSNDADEGSFDITLTGNGATGLAGYQLWAASQGLEGPDADPKAIPFSEGVPNLSKYAFNMNGYEADCRRLVPGGGIAGLPCLRIEPGAESHVFRFEFLRRAGSGLVYTPMVSATLLPGSWTPLADEPTVIPLSIGWERVIYEDILDPALAPRTFWRVEIMLP